MTHAHVTCCHKTRCVRRSRPRGLAASGDGRPALAVKTIVVNPRDAPGWRAQSAAMDLAPMTLDLREELLDAFPPVAGRLARPFFASEEEGSALGAEDDEDASRKVTPPRESRPAGSREESRETRGVGPSVAGLSGPSVASRASVSAVRVGRVDLVVSFAALPFLPASLAWLAGERGGRGAAPEHATCTTVDLHVVCAMCLLVLVPTCTIRYYST